MRVAMLGTGSAEGLPGLFCDCDTCTGARAERGKNIRTRSSALIDGTLKIDFPPDTLAQVVRNDIDMRAIRAVLFTHGHDDHFSPAEIQYRGRYFVVNPLTEPLRLFGPRDTVERLKCELDPELVSYSVQTVEPETPVRIVGYEVFPFLANHDESRVCLNYVIISSDGTTLLYATDTGWYPDRTWDLLKQFHFDGIVVECTKRTDGGYAGHLSIPEVVRMRRNLEANGSLSPGAPVVATHFSHQMGMLHDELESMLAPHGVTPAYDGLTFDVSATC